jgi:hypothetical protein
MSEMTSLWDVRERSDSADATIGPGKGRRWKIARPHRTELLSQLVIWPASHDCPNRDVLRLRLSISNYLLIYRWHRHLTHPFESIPSSGSPQLDGGFVC